MTATFHGRDTVSVLYRGASGQPADAVLTREDEARLELVESTRAFGFDADPAAFKLALEGLRIHRAANFDPHLAVHTSLVEPLPHQLLAVYDRMLQEQPLRFLLADDPGAGKTIMSVLEEFIRVTASTPYRRPGSTKFEVHTALKGGSDDTFANVANWQGRKLKEAIDRLPGLSAVRFFAWNKDGWHDRYVLAKDAGLRFSVGLDKQTIDSQQSRTAVNHLKTREIGKYWKQYDERSARRGDLLGEIKLVS